MRYEIGSATDGSPLAIDLPKLVVSRLMIQASSGSGKSYLLRRILEQTHGAIQHIVIDVEGEFASLRSHFDYVLAAKEGGETTADPRAAALLAERILDLKVSAIIDIYELSHHDRIRFVRSFVDALVNAPKRLWHSALIVIDEANIFCPQDGSAESAGAVMDLCTRGRKRGFCPILATQRLSKLHKDAAAECLNRFIGRTSLDVDMKRAGDDLGFDKAQRLELRKLKPGEFFAYGPALASDVTMIRVGSVTTQHPKAGGRIRFKAPPPTAHIKALLPKLSDLPAEVETKERTAKEIRQQHAEAERKIATLTHEVKRRDERIAALEKRPAVEKPIVPTSAIKQIDKVTARIARTMESLSAFTSTALGPSLDALRAATAKATPAIAPPTRAAYVAPLSAVSAPSSNGSTLSRGNAAYRLLGAIKVVPGEPDARIGALAGISAKKSTYRVGIGLLKKLGYIVHDGRGWTATAAGLEQVRDVEEAPTGAKAVEYWRRKLGQGAARKMFDAMYQYGPGVEFVAIERFTGLDRSKSTFRVALQVLKRHGLITTTRTGATINEALL